MWVESARIKADEEAAARRKAVADASIAEWNEQFPAEFFETGFEAWRMSSLYQSLRPPAAVAAAAAATLTPEEIASSRSGLQNPKRARLQLEADRNLLFRKTIGLLRAAASTLETAVALHEQLEAGSGSSGLPTGVSEERVDACRLQEEPVDTDQGEGGNARGSVPSTVW